MTETRFRSITNSGTWMLILVPTAPPREIKDEALTPALSQINGLLVQLPDLGVEGSRAEVVIVLQIGQRSE